MLLFRFIEPAVKITNNRFTFPLCQKKLTLKANKGGASWGGGKSKLSL